MVRIHESTQRTKNKTQARAHTHTHTHTHSQHLYPPLRTLKSSSAMGHHPRPPPEKNRAELSKSDNQTTGKGRATRTAWCKSNSGGTTSPSLSTLPDDILMKIISLLPPLYSATTSLRLKKAYENLSLARLHPRFAYLSSSQVEDVTIIDPFPEVAHVLPVAVLPPYARPPFLAFLVALCQNLNTLRAPCLTGVLQYASDKLTDISFIDTGLADADLLFLSRSSLTTVKIRNPSPSVLTALAQVDTLYHVTLRGISEESLLHVVNFLECTSATSFCASIDSMSEQLLLTLLRGLPPLVKFVLECGECQLWALRYLRKIAVVEDDVEMHVGGVSIKVLELDEDNTGSDIWEAETMSRLICRKDFNACDLSSTWREGMVIHEIDLDSFNDAHHQGVRPHEIANLICDYFMDESRHFEDIHIRFGRIIPSIPFALARVDRISSYYMHMKVTNLLISQDIVLHAWKASDNLSWFLQTLFNKLPDLSTIQLCAPSEGRAVSARFFMGLPNFLSNALVFCPKLDCVYMEDAGELVLQSAGMPVLTDEKRVKAMIRAVIFAIRELEVNHSVAMGTVIAQLELWAGGDLRVVDGKDLDDVASLTQLTEQHCLKPERNLMICDCRAGDWCATDTSTTSDDEQNNAYSERRSSEDGRNENALSDGHSDLWTSELESNE